MAPELLLHEKTLQDEEPDTGRFSVAVRRYAVGKVLRQTGAAAGSAAGVDERFDGRSIGGESLYIGRGPWRTWRRGENPVYLRQPIEEHFLIPHRLTADSCCLGGESLS